LAIRILRIKSSKKQKISTGGLIVKKETKIAQLTILGQCKFAAVM
jgi:hypothetical protein